MVKQHCALFLAWLPYSPGSLLGDGSFLAATSTLGDAAALASASASATPARDATLYAVHPLPLSGAGHSADDWDWATQQLCQAQEQQASLPPLTRTHAPRPPPPLPPPPRAAEIKALHRHSPPLGFQSVTITLLTGVSLPPLHFHHGGVKAFFSALRQHASLARSAEDPNTFLVNDTGGHAQGGGAGWASTHRAARRVLALPFLKPPARALAHALTPPCPPPFFLCPPRAVQPTRCSAASARWSCPMC